MGFSFSFFFSYGFGLVSISGMLLFVNFVAQC